MNTSVKDFEIVGFVGFYGSCYDLSETEYNTLYDEARRRDMNVEDIDCDAYTAETEDYKKGVVKGWVDEMNSQIHELGLEMDLVAPEIESPRYYNYSNDKIYCKVECKHFKNEMRKILRLMDENEEMLTEIIKRNHTSYDGFCSFMSNEFRFWREYLANSINYRDSDFSLYFCHVVCYLVAINLGKRTPDNYKAIVDNYIEFFEYAGFEDSYYEINFTEEFEKAHPIKY